MHEVYLRSLTGDPRRLAITRFPFLIGRNPECDYRIDHPLISRRHCSFFLVKDEFRVQDLESRNGTLLNGERLSSSGVLHDGDRVDLANLAFQVRLPSAPAAPALKPGARVPAASGTASARQVLIVDDNHDAAESLAMVLRLWGHHVFVAHNGLEAISLARSHQPDTVLLDLRLPGMDGYEVAQQLRAQAGLADARLLAITGYPPEENRQRFTDAGLDSLLTKPVDPDVLQEALAQGIY